MVGAESVPNRAKCGASRWVFIRLSRGQSISCSAGRAQESDRMAASNAKASFKPALLVVDMQEDFCPPVSELALSCFELMKITH